jgi:hypothetical protein
MVNSCSTSEWPQIRGKVKDIVGSIFSCSSFQNDNINFCEVSIPECGTHMNDKDCSNSNYVNGKCVWILSENGEAGKCVEDKKVSCSSYLNNVQCRNNDFMEHENCYWDETDEKEKCKLDKVYS